MDTEINHFTIIKRSKLKISFDKGWWKNRNEISGEKWLRKYWSFYLTQNFLTCGSKNVVDLSDIRAKDVEPKLSKNVNTIQKYSDAD